MTHQEFLLSRFNKASDLLLFFVDVIENPPANFQWDMDSFGYTEVRGEKRLCLGCAATCAVLKLGEIGDVVELDPEIFGSTDAPMPNLRKSLLGLIGLDYIEHTALEGFFDELRLGRAGHLMALMEPEMKDPNLPGPDCYWRFSNENKKEWPAELVKVKNYIKKLKDSDL